ncbi:hypothetical protein Tcan_13299 [Toxocara canis]|uniref:Uncharacterized protein n=1 Tax=Toxocara canis TaxID=6265 RepID=A0A0B2VVQ3_TOXCA|nr:hypothetical protein Tcan_13299 [Toxocara canis]
MDTDNKGIDYYVAEAAAHRFHTLLMEAACRAKGVQLMFWCTGQVSCMLFGLQGPLYLMINNGRERIGLRGEPMVPLLEKAKRRIIPVAEQRNTTKRRTPRQRRQPSVQATIGTRLQSSPRVSQQPLRTPHTEDHSRIADQAIHPASRAHRYIIPAFVRETSQRRAGNSRDPFHRNTTGRGPWMRVNSRQAPKYARIGNKIGFCTKCMRFLEVPVRMPADDIKACVRSHRLGVCRRILYELGELIQDERETSPISDFWRMAEQALLPDDQPQPGPSNEPDQEPQARRKRPRRSLAEEMLEEFTKRIRED